MDEDEKRLTGVVQGDRAQALARKVESVRAEVDRLLAELSGRSSVPQGWCGRTGARPLAIAFSSVALVGGIFALAKRRRGWGRGPLTRLRRLLGAPG